MRNFDPRYQIRSRPANSEDVLFYDLLARHACMGIENGFYWVFRNPSGHRTP
jgi:hypothetical protein